MKLKEALEKEHTKTQRDTIVSYIGKDPRRFAHLVQLFLNGPYRLTQRASWPLSSCVEKHPELIKPHLKLILRHMDTPGIHDAVKRNTLRLLQYVDLPRSLQGAVADHCFRSLADTKVPVAIRAFAITVLTRLAIENPELKNELIVLIEQHLPYEKPAFVSRARKAIKELKQLTAH